MKILHSACYGKSDDNRISPNTNYEVSPEQELETLLRFKQLPSEGVFLFMKNIKKIVYRIICHNRTIAALIVIFYAKEESAPFRRSGQETISPARISLIAESPPVKIDFDAGDTLFAVLQKSKNSKHHIFS